MPPFADVLQWEHLPFPKSLKVSAAFPGRSPAPAGLKARNGRRALSARTAMRRGAVRLTTRPGVLHVPEVPQANVGHGRHRHGADALAADDLVLGRLPRFHMTPGISAVQFQRQLGLDRYETAFQILHKLRAGMVRPNRDPIGGNLARGDHVEVDETYIGGETRGKGKGVHADEKTLVIAAVEVRTGRQERRQAHAARRSLRWPPAAWKSSRIAPKRPCAALSRPPSRFGAMVVTDAAPAYNSLGTRGYAHLPVVEGGNPQVAEEYLPIVHLVFSNLKAWLKGRTTAASSRNICKPTSTNLPSALTAASTRSTPSARCSASARTAKARPMTGSTAASGNMRRSVMTINL